MNSIIHIVLVLIFFCLFFEPGTGGLCFTREVEFRSSDLSSPDEGTEAWKPGELEALKRTCHEVLSLMLMKDDPHQAVSRYYYLGPFSDEDRNTFVGERIAVINDRRDKKLVTKSHVMMMSQFGVFLASALKNASADQTLREAYRDNMHINRAEKEIKARHHWTNIPFSPVDFLETSKSEQEFRRFLHIRLKIVSLLKRQLNLAARSERFKKNFSRLLDDSLFTKTRGHNTIYYQILFGNIIEMWCVNREGEGIRVLGIGVQD